MFIKAHLQFQLEGTPHRFQSQNLAASGVSGLHWNGLSPERHFGEEIQLEIQTVTQQPENIRCRGRIVREATQAGNHMGIRLLPDGSAARLLSEQIRRFGFMPTDYVRKYPRVPADPLIRTFPLLAHATRSSGGAPEGATVAFNVINLSPNGILIRNDSALSRQWRPGERLDLVLEPRGWFPVQVKIQAMICWVADEKDAATGNDVRSLGLKFVKLEPEHRAAFLDLLQDILDKLQKQDPLAQG